MNEFETTVSAALKGCPPGVILAAVSGGADSTAMLVALAALRDKAALPGAGFDLRCIHVEHGIRPAQESRGDAEFVRSLCKQLRVPCTVVSIKPGKVRSLAAARGIGIEAAARLYRRRALFRVAARKNAARILTAHTADDALELTLMRILRGAGPSGLAAMPAQKGRFLRPLLALSRRDVTAYLAEKQIPWREDSTNADIQFLRNRVRRCLIPLLGEHFPGWQGAVNALAQTQSLAAAFIKNEAKSRVRWHSLKDNHGVHGVSRSKKQMSSKNSVLLCEFRGLFSLCTNAENFFAQPVVIREEALFLGVDRLLARARRDPGRARTVKRANIRRFCAGKVAAVDLGPLKIQKNARQVVISARAKEDDFLSSPVSESGFSLLIKEPGSYNLKGIAVEVTKAPSNEGDFTAQLPFVLLCENGGFDV